MVIRWGSWALAITFASGAVFHFVAVVFPTVAGTSSVTRHGAFVLINVLFGVGFALRWRYLLFPALVLAAQQTWSHGSDFLEARARGEWDVMSLGVLAMLPIMLVVAWAFWRASADVRTRRA